MRPLCGGKGRRKGEAEANPTSALPSFSFFDPKIGPKQRTTILLHIGGKGEEGEWELRGKGKKKAHVECEEDNQCSRSSILPPFPPPAKGRRFYFRGLTFRVSIFVLLRDKKKSLLPLRPTAIGVCVFLPPLVDCDDDIRGGREREEEEEEEASSDVGKSGGGGGGEARGATSEYVRRKQYQYGEMMSLPSMYSGTPLFKHYEKQNLIICVKKH